MKITSDLSSDLSCFSGFWVLRGKNARNRAWRKAFSLLFPILFFSCFLFFSSFLLPSKFDQNHLNFRFFAKSSQAVSIPLILSPGVLLRWLSASPDAPQSSFLSFTLSDKTLLLAAFLGSSSKQFFLHVLFEFSLPSGTRNGYLVFCFPFFFYFFLVLPILLITECHFQHLCFIFRSFSVNISNQDCHLLLHLCASFSMVSFIMAFFVSPSFRRVSDLLYCLTI